MEDVYMGKEGVLVMIVGPSGSGKDTIIQAVCEARPDIHKAISYTTRKIRGAEQEGVAYHFVDAPRFQEMINRGEFLEWAQFPPGTGDYYGTVKSELAKANTTLLKIEIQGARQVKEIYPHSLVLFIAPESVEVLRRRILSREEMSNEKLEGRLQQALVELEEGPQIADHVIVNKDGEEGLRKAVEEVLSFLSA